MSDHARQHDLYDDAVHHGALGLAQLPVHSHDDSSHGGQISHDTALTGVSANDHHAQSHDSGDHSSDLPRGSKGYAEATSDQGTFTTETDLTSLTVTFTTVTGRRYKITGKTRMTSSVTTDVAGVRAYVGSTQLNEARALMTANEGEMTVTANYVESSGQSRTFKLTGYRVAGTGNITNRATSTYPAFIWVEDVGT